MIQTGTGGIYENKDSKRVYRIVKELGKGTFGSVELCELLNYKLERDYKSYSIEELIKKKYVAMKRIQNETPEKGLECNALREIAILKEVKHKNIIKLIDVFADEKSNFTFVAMEYLTCDLGVLIDKKRVMLTDGDIKYIFREICQGINALHENWILHRVNIYLIVIGYKTTEHYGFYRWVFENNRFWYVKVC